LIWLNILLATLGGGILLALAVALVLFNLKRRRIIAAAERASAEQLELVYKRFEECGPGQARRFVLARTNRRAAADLCLVTIPERLGRFPWAGRTIAADAGREVSFRFAVERVAEPQLLGKVYRAAGVPRFRLKSGKVRSRLMPAACVSSSEGLRQALETVCPGYPVDLLSYLLCAGGETFEFEEINCALIGGRPAWAQEPAFPDCDHCKSRMALILQVPGAMLAEAAYSEATYYFFGCKRHPEHTKTVEQYT
jgi:hypothetical protein